MKKIFFFAAFALFLIFSAVYAKADEPNKYGNLIINLTFNTSFALNEKANVDAYLNLFPQNDLRQDVTDFIIRGPGAIEEQNDSMKYEWSSVDNAAFGWDAIIKTSFYISQVGHIPFPSEIEGFEEYKSATEYIDIDDEIVQKANELVAGRTDWFEAVHEIAFYVYNTMTYDINFANSQEKASWVMKNKKGVCDEYTVLFLALVRALGIPARYVSGVAYSNINKEFGNHAWAEIYNGEEWVPFDTTFGQFGWLDATHVALSKTSDAKITNVKYRYTSSNLTASDLNLNASVVGKTDELNGISLLEFNIQPLKDEIGAESFLPLKLSMKNKNDYYLPLQVYISKGVGLVGKNSMHILVPPLTTKTSFFIMTIPKADVNYIYTATIEARTSFNDIAVYSLDFSQDYEQMSLATSMNLVASLTESEVDYRYDASIDCMPLDDYYYGEEIIINCTISSDSNAMLSNLSICIKNQCDLFNLPINGRVYRDFRFKENETSYVAKLTNDNLTKTQFIPVKMLAKPNLQIIDISPKQISYAGTNTTLSLKANSICKNAIISINGINFDFGDIDKLEDYSFDFKGRDALSNKLDVKAECKDLRGNIYEDERVYDITVTNMPWYARVFQKIILFKNRIWA